MQRQKRFAITLLVAAFLAVVFAIPGLAHAQATITVVNLDGSGEGFNDNNPPDADSTVGGNTAVTLGEQRLSAFQYAADMWGNLLDSSVAIFVGANFDPLFCDATSAVLGSAGTNTVHRNFVGAPFSDTWYPAALANSLTGTDLAPTFDDIGATFNSSIGTTCPFPNVWYYGLDGNPPEGTIDFVTIVLHELGHGLGFQTLVNLSIGAKFNNFDDTFMLNLEDHTTGEVYPNMTDNDRVSASINTGNLHWVGTNVIADSGGLTTGRDPSGHVEMYAPNPQEPGSSVSHFSTSLSPDELMEPFYTGANQAVGLAEALMQDIGWVTVNPINGAPTSTSATITTDEDTASSGVTPSVTDPDNGDTHTFSIISQPANGTASVSSNQLIYTPSADFNGTDSFTFKATDTGGLWVEGTASVTVNPINDAPVAVNDAYSVDEDTTLTVALPGILGNDTDIDGDPLSAVLVGNISNGTLTLNTDGSFVYTPNANFTGTDIFTYQANDTLANSLVATVTITVSPTVAGAGEGGGGGGGCFIATAEDN
ncbi:MAG: Ig-like domain-containing protein [Syntrophobacteria bacterium]